MLPYFASKGDVQDLECVTLQIACVEIYPE